MNDKRNFDYKRLHPFKWYILENYPFLEDSIDALTNYQLFCKLGEMYNKEIDAINTLGIQVEGITDWFDNLDVQDEINNKLDEMAESGELSEIIEQYLLLNSAIICDTVNDMINNSNLLNGSIVKTLGFYNVSDGGDGLYKITNETLEANNIDVFELNNGLFASLVLLSNNINIKLYGAKEDDENFDNANIIKYGIDKLDNIGGGTLYIPTGKFYSSAINYSSGRLRNITIKGNGHLEANKGSEICFTGNTTLFSFNQLWNFAITDLRFGTTSNVARALNVSDGFYRCKIYNCTFKNYKYGIEAGTFAYIYIEKTNFSTDDLDDGFHIRLGHDQVNLCEFCYITECMFNGSDGNENFNGIVINAGSNYKINKCDFANLGESNAILIETTESQNIVDVDITNCNIIRCDKGIELYANTSNISAAIIDKLMYFFRGDNNDDIAIYTHRNSDYVMELYVKNLSLRQLATYTGNVFSINSTRGEIEILSNNTGAMPVVNNRLISYRYLPFKINNEYTVAMNGGTYAYIDLSSNSPFSEKPPLIIIPRTPMDGTPSCNIINTFKGQLRVMVSWKTAPTNGNYIFQIFTPNT